MPARGFCPQRRDPLGHIGEAIQRHPAVAVFQQSEANMNGPAAVTPAVGRSPQHNLPNLDVGRPQGADATASSASRPQTSAGTRYGLHRAHAVR